MTGHTAQSETSIMKDIQLEISRLGHRCWRNNVGFATTRNGCNIRYGLCVGSSDLIGFTKDGRFLAIEVKTATGKPTDEQINFIDAVNRAGGVGFICRSVEQLKMKLEYFS